MTKDPDQSHSVYARPVDEDAVTIGAAELIAGLLAVVWVVAVVVYAVFMPAEPAGPLGMGLTLLLVFMPLALIWFALTTLRSVRVLRTEAERLQTAVDAMRAAYLVGQQAAPVPPAQGPKPDGTAPETVTFASRRDGARKGAAPPADDQPALALGNPAEDMRPPLSVADFIRALHFPENADDKDGFRALRLALEDRAVAKLVRAAQDVLTLLSQEGIYMDDLRPERSRPEVWRRFAAGERGRAVAALGGIRDRSSLALTAGRMREDPVFRDAAHHFLRAFDQTFQEFEKTASDAEVAELAETRTARAFMLFGRVTGVFD